MANGKKNYFRHFAAARHDEKIIHLITEYGKEAYFHYFALLEMCAEKALAEDLTGSEKFIFHKRRVCSELMVTPQRLGHHLLAIQSSLLGHLVVRGEAVEIEFPKLPKYLGRYENKNTSKTSNKRKENKRKENILKISSEAISFDDVNNLYIQKISRPFHKPSFLTPNSRDVANFKNCLEFLKAEADWLKYFNLIIASSFLMGNKYTLNLSRILDPIFASDVLNGRYTSSSDVLEDALEKELADV